MSEHNHKCEQDHKHDDGHGHSHSHHRGHNHGPANYNKAFAIGIALNLGFVVVEATYGFIANSLALMADAGHNLSDVIGLVLAWAAIWFSKRKPDNQFTYGLRRSSILSALLNAVLLLLAVGAIAWEAIRRFSGPAPVQTNTVMIVAFIGILINGITALMFMSGRKSDLNIRGAYLHMASDALVSVGVVIAAFIIQKTNWIWIDPTVSIVIAAIITVGTWGLLKDSIQLSLDGVPSNIKLPDVRDYLSKLNGVQEVHDLHIWAMSTTETALTVHLVIEKDLRTNEILAKITEDLKRKFQIAHPTVQFEINDSTAFHCVLKPDEVV